MTRGKQSKKDRIAIRHTAKFTSLKAVQDVTGIPKDRIAKFEDKGARDAEIRFFDALELAKHYGVSLSELVGEDLGAVGGECSKPEFNLSTLEAAIIRNCRRMGAAFDLFFLLSETFVEANGQEPSKGRFGVAISDKRLEEYEKDLAAHVPLNEAKIKHGLIPRSLKRQKVR